MSKNMVKIDDSQGIAVEEIRGYSHEIFSAISEQNFDKLSGILSQNIDIEVKNEEQRTPLDFAIHSCNLKAAEMLMLRRANVNSMNQEGLTPLHTLIKCSDSYENMNELVEQILNTVKQLITNGAKLDVQDRRGNTVINCIAQRAKVNKPLTDFFTKIGKIALNNDKNVSETVQIKNNMGKTPLDYLSRNGNVTLRDAVFEALPQNRAKMAKILAEGNLAIERALKISKEEELA